MAVPVAAAIMLVACGGDSTSPDQSTDGSSYEFTISGDLQTTVSDDGACHSLDPRDSQGIVLFNGASQPDTIWLLTLFRPSGGAIDAGTGAIADDDWLVGLSRVNGQTLVGNGVWSPVGGTVTITALSGDRVQGSFSFTAEQDSTLGQPRNARNISVSGTFDARQPIDRATSRCG